MARGLKSLGLQEIALLKRRVKRQFSLGRINPMDAETMLKLINKLEAFIISMDERPERGEGWEE